MKRIILLCLCMLVAWSVRAQYEAENKAFKAGERVTYDLYFNWKFVWVKAGTAEMAIHNTTYHGEPAYRTYLQTKGNKRADFFFVMRDTLENVMSEKLVPYFFRKGAEEGKHYTVDSVTFTYKNGKSHIRQSRHRRGRDPKFANDVTDYCVYDMLSILHVPVRSTRRTTAWGRRYASPWRQVLPSRSRRSSSADGRWWMRTTSTTTAA